MSKSSSWQRVSRRRPCPVCGKPDWCMHVGPEDSPDAVICARIESAKRCGAAGWLHVLRHDSPTWAPWRRTIRAAVRMMQPEGGPIDFGKLSADFVAAVKPEALARLAASLGVSVESLGRLGIGWSGKHRAWSFPMRDAGNGVVGIRLRCLDGSKLSVRGGREGLFIPEADLQEVLLICEGPTDTAALLDMGFSAVGRPSCTGGVKLLCEVVKRLAAPEVVIMADSDAPGQRGAESLASVLLAYSASVRVITPPAPFKDAREWKRRGASRQDVEQVIVAAPIRRLAVTVRRKAGGKHERR